MFCLFLSIRYVIPKEVLKRLGFLVKMMMMRWRRVKTKKLLGLGIENHECLVHRWKKISVCMSGGRRRRFIFTSTDK